jgi:hypothetical protein
VIGPTDDIALDPGLSEKWDYEAEIALVIGRDGRSIPEERAWEQVFGFCVANDVSQRQRACAADLPRGGDLVQPHQMRRDARPPARPLLDRRHSTVEQRVVAVTQGHDPPPRACPRSSRCPTSRRSAGSPGYSTPTASQDHRGHRPDGPVDLARALRYTTFATGSRTHRTSKVAIIAMSSCSRLWQWKT